MNNTIKLLDRARDLCSPKTDYQLAKRTGISQARISAARHKRRSLDNEAAIKLAKIVGLEPITVIAYFEEDRATTPEKREFWRCQLPRVLPAIAIAGAALWALKRTLIAGAEGTDAATIVAVSAQLKLTGLYIMRSMMAIIYMTNPYTCAGVPARQAGNEKARYLAAFFGVFGFAAFLCGLGGVLSILRRTSSIGGGSGFGLSCCFMAGV